MSADCEDIMKSEPSSCDEIQNIIQNILSTSIDEDKVCIENGLKIMRNLCALDPNYQLIMTSHQPFIVFLYHLLFNESIILQHRNLHVLGLQLTANAIVANPITQRIIWSQYGPKMMENCGAPPLSSSTNIQLMIMYNIFKGDTGIVSHCEALHTAVRVWKTIIEEKCNENFEFLHFFFEYFLTQDGRATIKSYSKLDVEDKIAFLDYLANYLRNDSPNGKITSFLLQYISKEFKLKSDCVLRQTTQLSNQLHPREVHYLLRIIAIVSGCEMYAAEYASDNSLFLNTSSLLRCLVSAGKSPNSNIPAPMTKLEEVALSSEISHDFESDCSFELKTLLVRCVANLLYKNKVNQEYCLDTQLMPALLECTVMDARNPLIREWSILAIRNACVGCPEIQQVIANLTMQGMPQNDILSELNLKMGSLRIQSKNP